MSRSPLTHTSQLAPQILFLVSLFSSSKFGRPFAFDRPEILNEMIRIAQDVCFLQRTS